MKSYSETLERNHLKNIQTMAKSMDFELRTHVGGSDKPSCALLPLKGGKTFVFANLDDTWTFLKDMEKQHEVSFGSHSSINLKNATIE